MSMYGKNHYNIKEKKIKEYFKSKKKEKKERKCGNFLVVLEKEKATHSSILAWRISWIEQPSGIQSMGSHRVRHD